MSGGVSDSGSCQLAYDGQLILSVAVDLFIVLAMVRCKNAFGAPGNDERYLPLLTAQEKAKGSKKMLAKKKRKHHDANVEMAIAVAAAAERAERGVGVHVGDHLTTA